MKSASRLRILLYALIGLALIASVAVMRWRPVSPKRTVTRQVTIPSAPPETSPQNQLVRRRPGPSPGAGGPFFRSQPVYEGTNLGNWYSDLQSTNPVTAQRAREALAALGVDVPSTAGSTGVTSNGSAAGVEK